MNNFIKLAASATPLTTAINAEVTVRGVAGIVGADSSGNTECGQGSTCEDNHYFDGVECKPCTSTIKLDGKGITVGTLLDFSKCQSVEILWLNNNQMTEAPDLKCNTALKILRIQRNKLSVTPDLSNNRNLTELYLDQNKLTNTPVLSSNTALTVLRLADNKLTDAPVLTANTALTTLDLQYNELTQTPVLTSNTALEDLYMDGCGLTKPPDLRRNTALEWLGLGDNKFTEPPDLTCNTKLVYVDLINNQLTCAPDLKSLAELRTLRLYGNQLSEVPDVSSTAALYDMELTARNPVDVTNKFLAFPTGRVLASTDMRISGNVVFQGNEFQCNSDNEDIEAHEDAQSGLTYCCPIKNCKTCAADISTGEIICTDPEDPNGANVRPVCSVTPGGTDSGNICSSDSGDPSSTDSSDVCSADSDGAGESSPLALSLSLPMIYAAGAVALGVAIGVVALAADGAARSRNQVSNQASKAGNPNDE